MEEALVGVAVAVEEEAVAEDLEAAPVLEEDQA